MRKALSAALIVAFVAVMGGSGLAAEYKDTEVLLSKLKDSKRSLADGIKQGAQEDGYVISRIGGPPHGKGSLTVIDFATRRVMTTWRIPGGGSLDMGNVSADGKVLWLSGRYDDVVDAIDTST